MNCVKAYWQGNKILEKNNGCKALILDVIFIYLIIKFVRNKERFADEFARKLCTINDIDILNKEISNAKSRFLSLEEKIKSIPPIWITITLLFRKTYKNMEQLLKDNPGLSKILFSLLIDFRHEYPIDSIKKSEQRIEELIALNGGSHENS